MKTQPCDQDKPLNCELLRTGVFFYIHVTCYTHASAFRLVDAPYSFVSLMCAHGATFQLEGQTKNY